MEVTFEDKFRISTLDKFNYIVEELKLIKPKDKPSFLSWELIGYYGTFEACLKVLMSKRLNRESAKGVKQ